MKKLSILLLFSFIITFGATGQITKKVLFEEGTNASCGPCAANNPTLISFLQSNASNVLSIMYHASWPGVDPMYSANPTQSTERIINYYNMGASGVPYCNCDGLIQDIWPFSNASFTNAMNTRLTVGAPAGITVTDTRIAGDSIRSHIVLNIPSALSSGTYKLRVFAIEKKIVYATPPGTNGETTFYTVFRRAYPNTTGTAVTGAAGVFTYDYTYARESAWVDTSICTIAFVQNDVNKEVLNAAMGSYTPLAVGSGNELVSDYKLNQNYPNPFNPSTKIEFSIPKSSYTTLRVYDIMGREIAVLMNGMAQQGNYSVDFNASNLSSGIYFYKLVSGSFSDIKKMNLVK
jgi:hypothetical protein